MIRLTAQQAKDFGEVFITPWFCIKPIEIKDGSFILPEEVMEYLPKFELKEISIATSVKNTLSVYPKRKLVEGELKEVEEVEIKPVIKK